LCNKKQEIQGILIFFGLDLGTLASIEVFMYAIVLHVELTRSLRLNTVHLETEFVAAQVCDYIYYGTLVQSSS
jgi:hypothetical protein